MSGRRSTVNFRMRRDSVPLARRHVTALLEEWRLVSLAEVAEQIVSELVGNATQHARGIAEYFQLTVRCDGGVVVLEVSDSCQWSMPELARPKDDEESGRGLLIVDYLAARWGVRSRYPGKTVWAELAIPAGGATA